MQLELDSEARCRVAEEGATPVTAIPLVNFAKLKAASIIDDF